MPLLDSHPCTYADWPAVALICRATLPEFTESMLSYALCNYHEDIRVFTEGREKVVGYWMNNRAHGHGVAWLEQVAVTPTAQGKGYGRRILEHYEASMADMGFKEIQFAVFKNNTGAIALYEKSGYERLPREAADKYTYRKPLPPSPQAAPERLSISFPAKLLRRALYVALVRA